jgi:hypothetical protein
MYILGPVAEILVLIEATQDTISLSTLKFINRRKSLNRNEWFLKMRNLPSLFQCFVFQKRISLLICLKKSTLSNVRRSDQ